MGNEVYTDTQTQGWNNMQWDKGVLGKKHKKTYKWTPTTIQIIFHRDTVITRLANPAPEQLDGIVILSEARDVRRHGGVQQLGHGYLFPWVIFDNRFVPFLTSIPRWKSNEDEIEIGLEVMLDGNANSCCDSVRLSIVAAYARPKAEVHINFWDQ